MQQRLPASQLLDRVSRDFLCHTLSTIPVLTLTNSHANKRTDRYGGSVENRCRFLLEVVDAILSEWKSGLVGIKICPTDDYNDSMVPFDEMNETYDYLIRQLMSRELGYINLSRRGIDLGRNQDDFWKSDPRPKGYELPAGYDPVTAFTPLIKNSDSQTMLMANHEYTPEEAEEMVRNDQLDILCLGRPFIHNPVRFSFCSLFCCAA